MEELLKIFYSGSSSEGQSYANHFRRDRKLQDVDIMMEVGCLFSDNQLIPIGGAPGFVLVKWSPENQIVKLPHKDGFIDGFQIKQLHRDRMKPICDASSFLTTEFKIEPNLASIEASLRMDLGDQSSLFNDSLKYVEMLRRGENKGRDFVQYYEWAIHNASTIGGLISSQMHMSNVLQKSYFQDYYSMLSPAFGFRLPIDQLRKAEAILNFYFKYRLQSSSFISSVGESENLAQSDPWSIDCDFVPSIKLNFWPHDMQWFLDRLKMNRPLLFEKIELIHMHIIPKWSGKTTTDKNLEFRYSFSAIEMKIAEERSLVEQILNQVARGLFYKYLHKGAMASSLHYEKNLPSYFVKTTVLWMCEEEDLTSLYTVTTTDMLETEKMLATRMARRWIAHVCSALKSRYYPHYFIKNYNLLDEFSEQYLDRLCDILQNDVDLQDNCMIVPEYDLVKNKIQTEKLTENMNNFLENMDDESEFIVDSVKLYNEFMNGLQLKFDFLKVNNEENSDDDDDTDIDAVAVTHCYTLLEFMARYDNPDMNNWELWKKLFIIDVPEQAPELPQHVKTTRSTTILTHFTMASVLSVKEVDKYISDRESHVMYEKPLSLPILPTDDTTLLGLTRILPMIHQQLTSEPYRRTILERPENVFESLVQFTNRLYTDCSNHFFYSEQIELTDEVTQPSPSSTKIHSIEINNESLITQTIGEERPLGKKQLEICISQLILSLPVSKRCSRMMLNCVFFVKQTFSRLDTKIQILSSLFK